MKSKLYKPTNLEQTIERGYGLPEGSFQKFLAEQKKKKLREQKKVRDRLFKKLRKHRVGEIQISYE